MYINVGNGCNLSRVYIYYFTKTQKLWLGNFFGAKVTLSKESKFGNPWLEIWKTTKRQESEKSVRQAVLTPWEGDTHINQSTFSVNMKAALSMELNNLCHSQSKNAFRLKLDSNRFHFNDNLFLNLEVNRVYVKYDALAPCTCILHAGASFPLQALQNG